MCLRQFNRFARFPKIRSSHDQLSTARFSRTLKYAFQIIRVSFCAMVYSAINGIGEVDANLLRTALD
jgi:hypothetical protein